jgi:hypothetical protein
MNKKLLLLFFSITLLNSTYTASGPRSQTSSPVNFNFDDEELMGELNLPTQKPIANKDGELDGELERMSGRFTQLFSPGTSSTQPGRRSLSDLQPLRALSAPFTMASNKPAAVRKKRSFSEQDSDDSNEEETRKSSAILLAQNKVAEFVQTNRPTTRAVKPVAQKALAIMPEDTEQE